MTGAKTADQKNFATTEVHGVVVQATSLDNYLHMAVVAGLGWVGVAGGISISIIDSDTRATIGAGAKVNRTGGNNDALSTQSVYVNAGNIVEGFSFAGSVAGGVGAVAGAVDFGTIKNDAFATIEAGAQVSAKDDVEVNALGIKNVQGFSFSGAGGAVALAASVSVWSIGSTLERNYSDDQGVRRIHRKGKSTASRPTLTLPAKRIMSTIIQRSAINPVERQYRQRQYHQESREHNFEQYGTTFKNRAPKKDVSYSV